jgi:hypothetical protein
VDGGTLAAIVTAAVAVCGSIGSVLLLAVHVGKLTGDHEARIKSGEDDRRAIWQGVGVLTGRFDRHIETHGRLKGWR